LPRRRRRTTKRRTTRRAYTPKRRRRRTTKRRMLRSRSRSTGDKVFDAVKKIVPWYVFSKQLTDKDYSILNTDPGYKNQDIATKGKIFANIVLGRISGFTPFKNGNLYGSETTPFTINPSGIVNKFTGLGLAGMIYKNLPIKQLPLKSKIGSLSKATLISGAIGGLFDAPGNNPQATYASPNIIGRNMILNQNRSASAQTGQFSTSQDVVSSGVRN